MMFTVEVAALILTQMALIVKYQFYFLKAFEVDVTAEHSIIYRG